MMHWKMTSSIKQRFGNYLQLSVFKKPRNHTCSHKSFRSCYAVWLLLYSLRQRVLNKCIFFYFLNKMEMWMVSEKHHRIIENFANNKQFCSLQLYFRKFSIRNGKNTHLNKETPSLNDLDSFVLKGFMHSFALQFGCFCTCTHMTISCKKHINQC